jgi:hypothetical protein
MPRRAAPRSPAPLSSSSESEETTPLAQSALALPAWYLRLQHQRKAQICCQNGVTIRTISTIVSLLRNFAASFVFMKTAASARAAA